MISRIVKVLPVCLLVLTGGFAVSTSLHEPEASSSGESEPVQAVLKVDVTDLKTTTGSIRISIYSKPDGFMKDDSKAVAKGSIKAEGDLHEMVFKLPPGKYAVALFHDKNDNGKLDTNFLGIPSEGYGVSNNPKPKFRAPKYKEALFDLPEGGKTTTVSLQYVG